jgi:hypothetical protein
MQMQSTSSPQLAARCLQCEKFAPAYTVALQPQRTRYSQRRQYSNALKMPSDWQNNTSRKKACQESFIEVLDYLLPEMHYFMTNSRSALLSDVAPLLPWHYV